MKNFQLTIEELIALCQELKLSPNQMLSAYFLLNDRAYPLVLSDTEYKDMYARGLFVKSGPSPIFLELLDNALERKIRKKPKVTVNEKISPYIAKMSEILDPQELGKDSMDKLNANFKDQHDCISLYLLWLNLFPSEKPHNNVGWSRLFGVQYKGYNLRISSEQALKHLKLTMRNKDMGVYIFGTYLFIKKHIFNGVPYIPKITNFFKEDHIWYDEAKAVLDANTTESLYVVFNHDYQHQTQNQESNLSNVLV